MILALKVYPDLEKKVSQQTEAGLEDSSNNIHSQQMYKTSFFYDPIPAKD
jgi:hypothetical protein